MHPLGEKGQRDIKLDVDLSKESGCPQQKPKHEHADVKLHLGAN